MYIRSPPAVGFEWTDTGLTRGPVMAGRWEQTRTPGIYVQEGPRGKRYKAAFRDARGVVTSKTFPRMGRLRTFSLRRGSNDGQTPARRVEGCRTMSDLWEHVAKTYRGKPSTFASYLAQPRS
jgi:hypothetical protein